MNPFKNQVKDYLEEVEYEEIDLEDENQAKQFL